MTLKEKLFADLKEAMKNKDTVKRDCIQVIRGAILMVEKDSKVILDDAGVTDVLAKELKKRQDVLPDYEKSGRQDLLNEQLRQIDIIKSYLPEPLSEEELFEIVAAAIKELGAQSMKEMGKVMVAVKPKICGRADNKHVSELIKNILSGM